MSEATFMPGLFRHHESATIKSMVKLIAGSVLLSVLSLADSVSYSSTCQSHGVPEVTGTTICSSTPYGPYQDNTAVAQTSLSLALAPAPVYNSSTGAYSAELNALTIGQSATATIDSKDTDQDHVLGYTTRAETSLSYTQTLTTVGSGFGFIHVVFPGVPGLATDDTGYGTVTINMTGGLPGYPSLSATCGAAYDTLGEVCEESANHFQQSPYIPFALGQNFTISANAASFAASDLQLGNGYAAYAFSYQFQVLAADLVTPIQLTEAVPEPSSLALVLIASSLTGLLLSWTNRTKVFAPKVASPR